MPIACWYDVLTHETTLERYRVFVALIYSRFVARGVEHMEVNTRTYVQLATHVVVAVYRIHVS